MAHERLNKKNQFDNVVKMLFDLSWKIHGALCHISESSNQDWLPYLLVKF